MFEIKGTWGTLGTVCSVHIGQPSGKRGLCNVRALLASVRPPPGDKSHLNWPSWSKTGTDEENRGYEGTVIFNGNTFGGIALPILTGRAQIKGSQEGQP